MNQSRFSRRSGWAASFSTSSFSIQVVVAGETHSLAWIPPSIHTAGLLPHSPQMSQKFFFLFLRHHDVNSTTHSNLSPEVIMRCSQPERVEEVGLLSGLGDGSKHLEVREVRNILYHRIVKTQPDKIFFHDNDVQLELPFKHLNSMELMMMIYVLNCKAKASFTFEFIQGEYFQSTRILIKQSRN